MNKAIRQLGEMDNWQAFLTRAEPVCLALHQRNACDRMPSAQSPLASCYAGRLRCGFSSGWRRATIVETCGEPTAATPPPILPAASERTQPHWRFRFSRSRMRPCQRK